MLGKIEGRRRSGWQRTRWLDGVINSTDISLSKLQEKEEDREVWSTTYHGVTKSQNTMERLNNNKTKLGGRGGVSVLKSFQVTTPPSPHPKETLHFSGFPCTVSSPNALYPGNSLHSVDRGALPPNATIAACILSGVAMLFLKHSVISKID